MKDFWIWIALLGIFIGAFAINSASGLFLAKFCRRHQAGRNKFFRVVLSTLAFTFGITTSIPVMMGIFVLITGGGYTFLTFEAFIILTGILQSLAYFGFAVWKEYKGQVYQYDKWVLSTMAGCGIASSLVLWLGFSGLI